MTYPHYNALMSSLLTTPAHTWLYCFSLKKGAVAARTASAVSAVSAAHASVAKYFQDTWLPAKHNIKNCQVRAIAPETTYMILETTSLTETWTYYTQQASQLFPGFNEPQEHKDVPHPLVKVLVTTSGGEPFVGWMWLPEVKDNK